MARLSNNYYGKADVRLTKVARSGSTHTLFEYTVRILLGGAFDRVYTHGDNSLCVPTDTMKNTVFALAKKSSFSSPEEFAGILCSHFIEKFEQVASAEVTIQAIPWQRISIDGKPHGHAFTRGGSGQRLCTVRRERSGTVHASGGLAGLEVIKTSGSAFSGFLKDEYTTLPETGDRIFATMVDATWKYSSQAPDYNRAFETAQSTLLEVFAARMSLSVQQTIYEMGEALLERLPEISSVTITMPNQHHIPVNLEAFHLTNANEIFVSTREPFGLINGTIERD